MAQVLNYAKAHTYIIVLWKYQLEHTPEQMGSMQICIAISATAASINGIEKKLQVRRQMFSET